MSCNEYKVVLRAELPVLKGCSFNDAYNYFKMSHFKDILGEPTCLEVDDDGIVEYFSFEKTRFQPVYNNDTWGIDYIIEHTSDFMYYIIQDNNDLTLQYLNQIADKLVDIFGVNKDKVKLHSYNWYNGSDEPIKF